MLVHKQEFVPFLLNFLREQSSQALTHGPATPAKTPGRPKPAAQTQGFTDRKSCRSTVGGAGSRSASRVQLFSPTTAESCGTEWDAVGQSGSHCLSGVSAFSSPSFTTACSPASRSQGSERRPVQRISLGDYIVSPPELQHSPNLQSQKSRRRSGGGMLAGGQGRRGGHHNDESVGRRTSRGGGGAIFNRISEQVSPPKVEKLNLNNLDDFPPVGLSPVSSEWVHTPSS